MEKLLTAKNGFYVVVGTIGAIMAPYIGGFDALLMSLIFCMVADWVSGLIVALVFKNSPKTETGGAQSMAGLKGLIKKVFILVTIAIVVQIDTVLKVSGFDTNNLLRNGAIVGFIANEVLSFIENIGLMGLKLPRAVTEAIDILKKKGEEKVIDLDKKEE